MLDIFQANDPHELALLSVQRIGVLVKKYLFERHLAVWLIQQAKPSF